MIYIIYAFTLLQFLAIGSGLGKLIGDVIGIIWFPENMTALSDPWYLSSLEYLWSCLAFIGICAIIKGILRFIENRR